MGTDHDDRAAALPDREITPEQADGPVDLETAIARQVRRYRIAAGLSVAEMAARVGISKAMLSKIENANTSCSLTTLGRLATGLNVPVTALFRGVDTEREAVYVPAGHGAQIIRRGSRVGHLYELLGALRGPHKRMEAVLVTLTESSEVFPFSNTPAPSCCSCSKASWSTAMERRPTRCDPATPSNSTARAHTAPRSCSNSPSASCPSPLSVITEGTETLW